MFKAIEDKALALYVSLLDRITEVRENEAGQTSAEYIAVTAVAVVIALRSSTRPSTAQLTSAITAIGDNLSSWVTQQRSCFLIVPKRHEFLAPVSIWAGARSLLEDRCRERNWVEQQDQQDHDEAGQTNAEYIAVTALAVTLALTVVWATLSSNLTDTINLVGAGLMSFIESTFP